jgi:hypothetical protein
VRRLVHFMQQIQRAFEEGIRHCTRQKFLKREPSRRKKKARKGASSSDGSQPATDTRIRSGAAG